MADLVLEGHKEAAEFALGVSSAAPLAASGGRDAQVRGRTDLRVLRAPLHQSLDLWGARGREQGVPKCAARLSAPLRACLLACTLLHPSR